jgi:guanylate kinase
MHQYSVDATGRKPRGDEISGPSYSQDSVQVENSARITPSN